MKAAADDDDARRGAEPALDGAAVVERAQVEDVRQIRTRQVEPAHIAAGGQQEFVIGQGRAVLQGDGLRVAVDRGRPGSEPAVDAVFVVIGLIADQREAFAAFGLQQFLGQGRPFVGQVRFRADQDNLALEPEHPHGFGRAATGVAGADDDECLGVGHGAVDPLAARVR